MKILIINQPLNNRGDESAHKALLRTLCKELPEVDIRVLFVNKNNDSVKQFDVALSQVVYLCINPLFPFFSKFTYGALRHHIGVLKYLHPAYWRIRKQYKWADKILCAPGGICMGGFRDWEHMFFLKEAKSLKKPLAYYGRSFGPFYEDTNENKWFKKLSMSMLDYFGYISIRDKKSENIANQLGSFKYYSTVDTAFLDSVCVEIPQNVRKLIGSEEYLVFVPNLLIWHYAYAKYSKEQILRFYLSVLSILVKRYPKHKIILLPQTFNYGNDQNDDYYFFCDIKKESGMEQLVVLPDKYSSDIQQSIIAGASCMIGTRYHSVVFAINQGIPFIALSYEHKISGLLETIGKQSCMVDITTIFEDNEKLKKCVNDISDKLSFINPDITSKNKAKSIAKKSFDEFVIWLSLKF